MIKAQYSTLRNYAATYFACTSIRCDIYSKGSLIQFKKIRRACNMIAQLPKSSGFVDESRRGNNICSMSTLGSSRHLLPSTSNFMISSKSGMPSYVAFAKRMLSTKPMVSYKHQKCVKAFTTQGSIEGNQKITFLSQVVKKNSPDHRIFVRKNVNGINSNEVLSRDGEKEESVTESLSAPNSVEKKVDSKTERKPKQRSRNKKKKEEPSETQSSLEALPWKSSRKVKKPNGFSSKIAENSSIVDISEAVVHLSDLPQATTKKKASKSRKKGNSFKEDDSEVKVNGVLHEHEKIVKETTFTSKALQKAKPLNVNGIKSFKLKPLYPPIGKSILVVESLTKAKVIQQYLGDMYEVLPSYGHVRDLAARSGSVRPDDNFSMVWEVPSSAWTHLRRIKVAISGYVLLLFDVHKWRC